jgi:predicted  nucleic acid-binding Zn-ribbon protein
MGEILIKVMEEIWAGSPLYKVSIGIGLFFIVLHIALYNRLNKIYKGIKLKTHPLYKIVKDEFNTRRQSDGIKTENFIQEFFSSYRLFKFPVVNLIKFIKMTVSLFILLGVLGTFIGLTDSLRGLNIENLTSDPNSSVHTEQNSNNGANEVNKDGGTDNLIIGKIGKVLSGIHVAFYTSIIGMSLSLLMTLSLRFMNTEHLYTKIMLRLENDLEEHNEETLGTLIKAMESVNHSLLGISENQAKSDEKMIEVLGKIDNSTTATVQSLVNLSTFSEGFNQAASNLEGFNRGLQDNVVQFTELFGSMKIVTDAFGDSVYKLNENFDQLFVYFREVDNRQSALMVTFQDTTEKLKAAFEKQQQFHDYFSIQMEGYVQKIDDIKGETHTYLTDSNRTLQSINDQSEKLINNSIHYQTGLMDKYGQLQNQQESLIQKLDDNIGQLKGILGAEFTKHLDGFRQTIDEKISLLANEFVQLSEQMGSYNQTSSHLMDSFNKISDDQYTYQKSMAERETSFAQMNEHLTQLSQQFAQINENINESVEGQTRFVEGFVEQQQQVAATYQSIETNNHELLKEINIAIENMQETSNSREKEIEATLKRLVNELDNSINFSFKKLVGEMSQYVKFTNDLIKNQLNEMGLINQTFQEGSSNHILHTMTTLQRELHTLNQTIGRLAQLTEGLKAQQENSKGRWF